MNLPLNHGVRSALEYAASGDLAKAHAVSNPELASHLEFVDLGGHGYGVVSVDATRMVTEFVCIPRPIERAATPDGGPLRYRVRHKVPLWQPGEHPQMCKSISRGRYWTGYVNDWRSEGTVMSAYGQKRTSACWRSVSDGSSQITAQWGRSKDIAGGYVLLSWC